MIRKDGGELSARSIIVCHGEARKPERDGARRGSAKTQQRFMRDRALYRPLMREYYK